MKARNTFTAHYISGTHWDREWYRPVQEYRLLLVKLIDELLDLMETNPHFRYFQLDGQTCVLQDYLEIRPENRDRLHHLITSGRILIGPWFTMPDLFCTGDEALIRNLLMGRRICREWGVEPMAVGFICDMFGHPSQMPQIFAGFNLNDVVLGRGTNEHTTPTYFHWKSPDGTRAFVFKLQDSMGYGAFAVPRACLERPELLSAQKPAFAAEYAAAGNDKKKRATVQEHWFRKELALYVNHEIERVNGSTLCLMDSMDHILPATDVARYLKLIEESCPNVKPVHSTLPAFFAEARKTARNVPVRQGELREPSKSKSEYLWLIPNCVSSRVRLKLANDRCQNLLERWVEPLLAIANLGGAKIPERFLQVAWQHVLTNHAHDSICGCSIDQVHRDMMYRFDQAGVLGEQLRSQAIGALTADCVDLARDKDEFTLTLFNPLPRPRDEVVIFDLDLPLDYPTEYRDGFHTQTLKSFTLEDAKGNPVAYQPLAFVPRTNERSRHALFCFMSDGEFARYTVATQVPLPALGFTSLRVKPSVMPNRPFGSMRTGPASAENEHLAIAVADNGTLTLTDKASNQTYRDLLMFEDRSEVGDGWFHGNSLNDERILSAGGTAQVSVAADGPHLVRFAIVVTLQIPACYDAKNERPAEQKVEMSIRSVVTLRRGANLVEVETTIDNTADDHRLRLLLPTDAARAMTYFAHHPFDFVERRISLDPQTANWQEMEQAEKPFLGLQAVGDGKRGLIFLSAGGLHEGGVADDAQRTMQITLFRSFRKTISTGGETDGLERGKIVLRYALMPYSGSLPRAKALRELAVLQAGTFTRQTGKRPSGFPPMEGMAPASQDFLQFESDDLVISAVKPAEAGGGLVVRFWNPTAQRKTGMIRFWKKIAGVQTLKLSEEPDDSAPPPHIKGSAVIVNARPHQIVTLGVKFKN